MSQHPAIEAGRTAVITGGASGIGLATAKKLAALGMNVVLFDLQEENFNDAMAQIADAPKGDAVVNCICVAGDVARPADLERLRDVTLSRFGDVALLMNNAGVGGGGGALEQA